MPTFDKISTRLSDKFMLGRSGLLITPDDGTYNLLWMPRNAFVRDVWLWVTTAYVGGTPVITVGWIGNGETAAPAGFFSNEIADVKALGLKRAMKDTLESFPGKYFNTASGIITCTVAAGGATTEGTFMVFVDYAVIY